jgi:ABC-2 type transport system permease protein
VVTSGVTVSAMTNSTVAGLAVLWIILYGGGFALSRLPDRFFTPDRVLSKMPYILRGYYDLASLGNLIGYAGLASLLLAMVGMIIFSRRDV